MNIQFLTQDKFDALGIERTELKKEKIPALARRIDEARQMGDLSENAEYHAAREDMGWAKGRIQKIDAILQNAEIISTNDKNSDGMIEIGSTITVEVNKKERTYTIVGAQEADPFEGKISNESPLGKSFIGKKKNDKVEVKVPAGIQTYTIKAIK
ncbi:MAG: transcription elongation factor GreA [Candidatus Magasanikbacteria bacterium]|jgi:transcription elongation factor GreA|nr:transcription elongation factor GreA [Candidatus Magasanikbacteria bacterium]MBT4221320.1 transcription elongation factor GreA [Candidatus Magasanikbacteria bacterium]MBT4350832.1 transcription elongation factor GreA [Candidatus Magasanikbacteria bacterium]MBT4542168.1 transcription elongation factor GreA [Candidatus Magasanikbacteria bacterium]MBT6253444.1 transcription elongation factor GreA [Candidatus Magasanikbacteria bacterium]